MELSIVLVSLNEPRLARDCSWVGFGFRLQRREKQRARATPTVTGKATMTPILTSG